jgi:hypothetical protein
MRSLIAIVVCSITPLTAGAQAGELPLRPLVTDKRIEAAGATLNAADALVTTGGRLVVMRAGDGALSLFADDGKAPTSIPPLRRSALIDTTRPLVVTAGRVGDRYWAFDEQSLRLAIISPTGDLIRTLRIPNPLSLADVNYGLATIEAVYPDSSVLFSASQFAQTGTALVQTGNALMRVARDGKVKHRYFMLPTGSGRLNPAMARAHPKWGVSSDGGLIASASLVQGGRNRDTLRVVVLRATGDTAMRATVLVTDANAAPIGRRLLVGTDGVVWLPVRRGDFGTEWIVLDRAGTPMARISTPAALELLSVDDGVWGVQNGVLTRFRLPPA